MPSGTWNLAQKMRAINLKCDDMKRIFNIGIWEAWKPQSEVEL